MKVLRGMKIFGDSKFFGFVFRSFAVGIVLK